MTNSPQAPTIPEAGVGEEKPVVGGFTLRWQIGQGAEGTIWAARHELSGEPAAVKILRTGEKALFEREARAVAGLDHPHIVRVFDYGEVPESAAALLGAAVRPRDPYLAMELAARGTLADIADELDWHRLARVIHAVLAGLGHAHARGVIHRDIKPGNILLTAEITGAGVRVSDFGIVHLQNPDEERPKGFAGTPRYAAPEQFTTDWRLWGPWTDLYAVGGVVWKMVTGKPVFTGNFLQMLHQHLETEPPEFLPRFPVPRGLERWLRCLLAKDPTDRFQFAAEAAAALESIEAEAAASAELRAIPESRVFEEELPSLMRVESAPDTEPVTLRTSALTAREMPADWRDLIARRPGHLHGAGLGLYALREAPFVGREPERDALWRELRRVCLGSEPVVVVLRGPSGVGKSRLARWLARRSHELAVAHTAFARHKPNTPRGRAARQALARLVRAEELELRKAEDAAQALLGVSAGPEITLDVAEFLADPADADRLGDARARHQAALHLLAAATADRPAVLCLDDVQWDDDAIHFAQAALNSRGSIRAMLILTVQDEGLAENRGAQAALEGLLARDGVVELRIENLSDADHRQLVGALLGMSERLIDTVCAVTAGSPLFAVQLVGEWVQRGAIRFGSKGFELLEGGAPDLPDGLHGLILDRFDGFSPGELVALELAACIEGEVDNVAWARACALEGHPLAPTTLMRLFRARLAEPSTHGWSFSHSILDRTLRKRAAEADRLHRHHMALARVFEKIGATGAPALVVAASHLSQAGEHEQAEAKLWAAVEVWEQRGDHQAVLAVLDRIEQSLDHRVVGAEASERRRVAMLRGWHLTIISQVDRGYELLDWVIETAETMPRDQLAHDALMYRGWNRYRASDPDSARGDLRQALDAYAKRGNTARHAECARYLAHAVVPLPDGSTQARALFEASLAGAGDNHTLRGQALLGIANLEGDAGDWRRAIAVAEAARSAFEAARKPLDLAVCDAFIGNVQIFTEEYEDALVALQRAIAGLIRVGVPPHVTQSITAMCLALMGRNGDALDYAARALATRRRAISLGWVCICFAVRAHVAAVEGDHMAWDAAHAELEELVPQQWRSNHEILQLMKASLPHVERRWPQRAVLARSTMEGLWAQLLRPSQGG